jgi:hypothetical protein
MPIFGQLTRPNCRQLVSFDPKAIGYREAYAAIWGK